jgi:pimeloyl-ACP methyl ester carboxylesterase
MKKFIIVNHNKLEVLQRGSYSTPIVILTGMGCSFEEWFEIIETLSKTNQVIVYHRPGLGESAIDNSNRNTHTAAEDLHSLLGLLKISEPVILVGHSYGGLIAQHFTKLHPSTVRALVLVDSTSVDFNILDKLDLPILNKDSTDDVWIEKCATYSLMSQEQLSEIIIPVLTEKQKQLPNAIKQRLMEFHQKPLLYKAMKSEIENWKKDAETIKSLGGIEDIYLVVIGRDKEFTIRNGIEEGLPGREIKLLEETWQNLIKEQIHLSRNSELLFANHSSHSVHMDRSDIVINGILKAIDLTSS